VIPAPAMTRDRALRSVEFLYRAILDRPADPAGLAFYADGLVSGEKDEPALALELIASPEFRRSRATPIAYNGYETIQALGCTFLAPEGSGLADELAGPDGYEPWVLPYFLEHCRPGMRVLDVGASIGAFALPAARRLSPGGVVYAVEASPQNCRLLAQSIMLNQLDNVRLLPLGAGDQLGHGQLRRQSTSNNTTIEPSQTFAGDIQDHDVVPVLPLDLLREEIGKIDLVKMDIEGMEYRAARGAMKILQADRPVVFMEYSPVFQQRLSNVHGSQLIDLFCGLGYEFEILHRAAARERVRPDDAVEAIDGAWQAHVREGGTHLDLCLHPPLEG
jgi:FkbM family methyltransferase